MLTEPEEIHPAAGAAREGAAAPLGRGRDYGRRRRRRRARALLPVEKGARSEVVGLRVASSRSHEVISGLWVAVVGFKLTAVYHGTRIPPIESPFDKARRIHVARTEEPLR